MATQTTNCGGGLKATWDDSTSGQLIITYNGLGTGIMNSYTSTSRPPWYNSKSYLTSLSLPDGIKKIGSYAFMGCGNFTGSLTIPGSVETIENYAFGGCSGFTGSLIIPDSVESINTYAFEGCSGFTGNLTIGSGVTTISGYAFNNCSGFTGSLTIGGGVTSIGGAAFRYCSRFSDVKFLGNQPALGVNAFQFKASSPEQTYDVYTNGWANEETFPSSVYTKWNYLVSPSEKETHVNVGGLWKKGTTYVKVDGVWKEGTPQVKVGSDWK